MYKEDINYIHLARKMNTNKECQLDCEYQHEGFCIAYTDGINPDICKAKTNDDLVENPDMY